MKYIDIDNWPRKHIFEFFKGFDYPHFNLTTNLDITKIYYFSKEKNIPLSKFIIYLISKSLNDIPEFKQRLRGDKVIQHDVIHPSYTILNDNKLFNFCNTSFYDDLNKFIEETIKIEEITKKQTELLELGSRDDLIYMTCIPWVSFTSVMHPVHKPQFDSVPRVAWGKYIFENDKTKLPISLQAHHCLVDGIHVGEFFNKLEEYFDSPEKII